MNYAKWIWEKGGQSPDTYVDFYDTFSYEQGEVSIKISADSNYALYINGSFVNSGQYPDFPHYKVYDEIDITKNLKKGENRILITVWYYGRSNKSYYPGNAGLYYEVKNGGEIVALSDENTLSRLNPAYRQGEATLITSMLGFSFCYDLNNEDYTLEGFNKSAVLNQILPLNPRPNEKCVIKEPKKFTLLKNEDNKHFVFDMGEEIVGLLDFKIHSQDKQEIKIVYGEYLEDGAVHYSFPNNRNFIVNCVLRKGENTYFNPFRRFGLRYFEVFAEKPIEVEYFTVRPTEYPIKRKAYKTTNPLRKQIFDVSTRTLELCMHDHFEDCPWREQGLYGMDARMSLRYSYYAFEDFEFARSNVALMAKAQKREDKLMPICTPSGDSLSIPTYALYFIISAYEYFTHSEDASLLYEVQERVNFYLEPFIEQLEENGLVRSWLKSENAWNFYDWAPGFDGYGEAWNNKTFDGVLNCLLVVALECAHKINVIVGNEDNYLNIAQTVRQGIEQFFDSQEGLYNISLVDNRKSEYVNSLAILCGAATGERAQNIADRLAADEESIVKASYPIKAIKYDALMQVDMEKHRDYILGEIDRSCKMMLDKGSTSFWETEEYTAACGSLCHAWSALAVYYYTVLEA